MEMAVRYDVSVDCEIGLVLPLQIPVKSEKLLPPDNRQRGVQCIQIGNLNILPICIINIGCAGVYALPEMRPLIR